MVIQDNSIRGFHIACKDNKKIGVTTPFIKDYRGGIEDILIKIRGFSPLSTKAMLSSKSYLFDILAQEGFPVEGFFKKYLSEDNLVPNNSENSLALFDYIHSDEASDINLIKNNIIDNLNSQEFEDNVLFYNVSDLIQKVDLSNYAKVQLRRTERPRSNSKLYHGLLQSKGPVIDYDNYTIKLDGKLFLDDHSNRDLVKNYTTKVNDFPVIVSEGEFIVDINKLYFENSEKEIDLGYVHDVLPVSETSKFLELAKNYNNSL